MSRQVFDKRPATDGGRMKHFCRIEKLAAGEDGRTIDRSLHQRPLSRDGAGRMENYLRIERGITA